MQSKKQEQFSQKFSVDTLLSSLNTLTVKAGYIARWDIHTFLDVDKCTNRIFFAAPALNYLAPENPLKPLSDKTLNFLPTELVDLLGNAKVVNKKHGPFFTFVDKTAEEVVCGFNLVQETRANHRDKFFGAQSESSAAAANQSESDFKP